MERITDINDSRLAEYVGLTDVELRTRTEEDAGIFIAESAKVVNRALDAGYEPLSLLVPEHRIDREEELVARFANEYPEVQIFCAPSNQLEKLVGYSLTRGVLSAMRRKQLPDPEALLSGASRVAVLEGITNHENMGSAFRNAAAFGVDAVLVTSDSTDPLYRRAVRVSMGNVFNVPWTYLDDPSGRWVHVLHDAGFKIASMALHGDPTDLDDPNLGVAEKLAIAFGTEGTGLHMSTLDQSDFIVRIPMMNGVDSLNVAATTAVAFWQLCRNHES